MNPTAEHRADAILNVYVPKLIQCEPPLEVDITLRDHLRIAITGAIEFAFADGQREERGRIMDGIYKGDIPTSSPQATIAAIRSRGEGK